jgi:long-chain acyl-CoA synthetase
MGSVHWPMIRQLARRARAEVVRDDSRGYRGADLLVAALHVADAIERATDRAHVGLLLPTSGAMPIAALGAWMAGRVIVPLNYLLKPDELQYVVDDSEIDTIVSVGPMLDHLGAPPRVKTMLRLEDLKFKSMPSPRWPAGKAAEDLACLLYTSGTSGKPKGVMLTHGNLRASITAAVAHAEFRRGDVFLGVLPQFHCFGLIALTLVPLTIGCRVVYTARFVPGKLLRLAAEHRPTAFIAIPAMYNALAGVKEPPEGVFSGLKYCVCGGEPLPDAVVTAFRDRFGVTINEGFGMTETSAATHWCLPRDYAPHSVGRALPGVEHRIVEVATGRDLGPNKDGELRLAGPMVMKGYFKLPEETARAFDERGFLRTGDIARLDDEQRLYITGRLKEMMIVGGENVFPREIEEVINRVSGVNASGVVGRKDPVRGEVPVAFVEMAEGVEFEEHAVLAACREQLAGYKVPRRVVAMEKLPRNATGKVMRRELVPLAQGLEA